MKILVIGGGGREHAIVKKLKESKRVDALYCMPGNAGIASDAVCVDGKATEIDKAVSFSRENKIDLVG